jgi:23S rRNA U2552 (ribose-2'-O)-methylase RlmE/FtsJ
MIEMIRHFKLIKKPDAPFLRMNPIQTFHLAEGPGGFIEAVCNTRSNPNDKYYGMTILEDENDDNVPAWTKSESYLYANPNIKIEVGKDGTGNILHLVNFDHCCATYASSMDIITADGGFDFSQNFNKQELSIAPLLWGQICYALCLQKYGGSFILKIFDSFYAHTIDILYILSGFYESVYVSKLQTSRIGNSEKYVVCTGFRFHDNTLFFEKIRSSFVDMQNDSGSNYIHRFLNIPIPRYFLSKVEEYNSIFGQQQIENIYYTISIIDKNIKNDKSEQLIKQNLTKCIHWCVEHGVPYNNIANNNIFLTYP